MAAAWVAARRAPAESAGEVDAAARCCYRVTAGLRGLPSAGGQHRAVHLAATPPLLSQPASRRAGLHLKALSTHQCWKGLKGHYRGSAVECILNMHELTGPAMT